MSGSARDRTSWLLALSGIAALAFAALKPRTGYHPVTPVMQAAASTMAGRPAPDLAILGTDGRFHSPASDSTDRPLVLIFIQDGCPCSEAADAYLRALQSAYGREVAFLGVMDSDLGTARDWGARHATPYPLLADPEKKLIAACRAERSAYVLLVAGGRVEALWPGYSARMLAEVGRRLSDRIGRAEVALDTAGAPEELASGCSF